jgi:hypothetical protein
MDNGCCIRRRWATITGSEHGDDLFVGIYESNDYTMFSLLLYYISLCTTS